MEIISPVNLHFPRLSKLSLPFLCLQGKIVALPMISVAFLYTCSDLYFPWMWDIRIVSWEHLPNVVFCNRINISTGNILFNIFQDISLSEKNYTSVSEVPWSCLFHFISTSIFSFCFFRLTAIIDGNLHMHSLAIYVSEINFIWFISFP